MKKHIGIRLLVISVLMLFSAAFFSEPVSAEEDLYIPDWTVYASLNDNGDLEITEYITFEFNEKYNGVYRDIDIDEAGGLSDISVNETGDGKWINYDRVEKAENGDKGVYTTEAKTDGTEIKIFSPSKDETKTFRISYVVKNVAVKYNDTGELYYKFLGDDNETPVGKFTVYLGLPYNNDSDKVKIFAHGPSNGIINKIEDNEYPLMYKLYASGLSAKTMFEVRLLFPADYIKESANIVNLDRYEEIINEETALQRKKEEERIRKEFLKGLFGRISLIISTMGIIVFAVVLYLCRRKIDGSILEREYSKIPEDCSPAVASYITGLHVNSNVFLATVLDLFNKGYIKLSCQDDNVKVSKRNFTIYKTRDADMSLLPHERYFMNWLFDEMGDGKAVSLKDIEYHSSHNSTKFYQALSTWKKKIKEEVDKGGYFDHSKNLHGVLLIILATICIVLGIITAINDNFTALYDFAVGLILFIYGLILFNRLSDKGYIQNMKWKSFVNYMKKHIKDLDLSSEDALYSLDKDLIYALGFGIFNKNIISLEPDHYMYDSWLFWYILFADTSGDSVNSSMSESFGQNSFSSGGGFTDGGGGGAGGGGAGGF